MHSELSLNRNIEIRPDERAVMESLLFCTKYKWMPILVEENQTGRSGKLVQNLAKLYGQPIRTIALNAGSDTSEVLGGFEQTGNLEKMGTLYNELLKQIDRDLENGFKNCCSAELMLVILSTKIFFQNQLLISDLSELYISSLPKERNENSYRSPTEVLQTYVNHLQIHGFDCLALTSLLNEMFQIIRNRTNQEDTDAQFDWVESVLVKAMKNGEWLLIEDANRCNPSVLDRLNGLVEENGKLEIGEKGCCENGKVCY